MSWAIIYLPGIITRDQLRKQTVTEQLPETVQLLLELIMQHTQSQEGILWEST